MSKCNVYKELQRMKACWKCKEAKSLSEFSKNRSRQDGINATCRSCNNALTKAWRKANKEKKAAYEKKWHQANRDSSRAASARWQKKNLDKHRAHNLFHLAKREGLVAVCSCAVCGSLDTEAHHEDHSKPYDVMWLCKPHHVQLHRRIE